MATNGKYLDYEGLKTYHNTLVSKLQDLEYGPSTLFESKAALLTLNNWKHDEYLKVYGLRIGLIVTVDDELWQLVNPAKFNEKLTEMGKTPQQKSEQYSVEDIGWKVLGDGIDYVIVGHTLQLIK